MEYTVKWGKERLRFPLPAPDAPLSEIRRAVAEYTHLPENSFKLVHTGSVMKDDRRMISEYGIKAKSVIAVVGDGQTLDGRQSQDERPAFIDPKNPRSQEDALLVLNGELDKIRATHGADVDQLLRALPGAPTPSSSAAPPAAQTAEYEAAARLLSQAPTKITEQQQQEHVRLGEYLLQALLRFDSINIDGEWTDARARRKLAVKEVQGLLDRLDAGWKRAKAIESS